MEYIVILFIIFIVSFLQENHKKTNSNQTRNQPDNTSKYIQDKNYPNKPRLLSKSFDWEDLRQQVFQKYGHKCMCCNSTNDIQVHHIISLKQGGTNNINNLMPLCKKCHEKLFHKRKFPNFSNQTPYNYGFKTSNKKKKEKGYIICTAVDNHQKTRLKIRYTSNPIYHDGDVSIRIIQPISYGTGFKYKDKYSEFLRYALNKVYVEAFCELRNEKRLFNFERIEILDIIS